MTDLTEREKQIVAWLREENGLCDCHAYEESECCCGVWYGKDKEWPLSRVADAIERGAPWEDKNDG